MAFQFKDANENTFVLNKLDYSYSISPYRRRVSVQPRLGKSGGVVAGDEQVDARDISFNMNIGETSESDYLNKVNSLIGFFLPENGPFFLEDTTREVRTEVRYLSYADQAAAVGLTNKVSNGNKFELKMLDSHWEDLLVSEVSSPSGGTADGESLLINNDGPVDCYPIITVSALGNITEFTLSHEELGISCKLGSNSFVLGTVFTIDCREGTIFLNDGVSDQEASSSLFEGTGFLKLKTGDNTIRYESSFGDCDISIEYRRRYPY